MEAETHKHKTEQNRGMLHKRNKETEVENGRIRVSRHEYACAYIRLCVQPYCMCMHTSSMHVHARSMHTHTHPKTLI